ncbi:PLP-dependent aminotransferase family protein [Aquincola sp. S2]|uniref:PLP-dependent aminotransferase family protein n=1 Tax=Pseudaquabacterium terrae TaxID=2732868 RepID=A0ABX2EKB4_9BURK|nr:PLP-dependent aminotransferase family protein [Aquabacterium terrae]NRF69011.1 PLP-dependent aminotransferase family protein [Aquabacterium terrae]
MSATADNISPLPPLYLQLADRLALAIRSGALGHGDRLPSVRQCAREQSVSVATVLQAYRHLEDARLVEARPKSGYFVAAALPPPLQEPDTSAPPADSLAVDVASLTERVMQMAADPHTLSFGAACPAPEFYDQERLRRALTQATRRHRALLCQYPQAGGNESARRAIARRALPWGCSLDPRDIVLTDGTTDAIGLCLQTVTRPGDIVALESPTSFGFLQVLQALHLRALEIPTHPRHGLSVDALALALQTQPVRALLAVPTLSNPLGASMPLGERKRLAQLLAEHQVPMIEDAIYNDWSERDEHRRAVRSFDTEGLVMLCSSFSKTVAPGLRIGWVDAGRFTPALRRLKAALSGGHTTVAELAMADLLQQPGYEPQLRRMRQTIARRVDDARRLIAESFPRGTRVTDPPGGIMLWLELPPAIDSLALFRACLEERICIAPGTMFSATDRYRHCIRLSVGGRWDDAQRQALRRIGAIAGAMLARAALPLAA